MLKFCIRMFGFYFALQLGGITLCTGALSFSKKPASTIYKMKGNDAVFEWEYSTDNKTAEVLSINWSVLNTTTGYQYLIAEDRNGNVVLSPTIPSAYKGRVEKRDQATLVIKNIDFKDSATFKCSVNGKTGVASVESEVQLVVTGEASVQYPVQFAEIGAYTTWTCNAIGVPSPYFKWKRQGEETTNGAKYSITSSGAGSSQLTIKNISVADNGYYVCDASVSVNQPSSTSCYVQVQFPLKQDDTSCPMRSYTVGVGERLSICCPVSGYPPPVVTWEKNGTQLQKGENNMYTITAMKDEGFGNYSCTATDGKSTIGPFDSSVMKMAEIPGISIDGTVAKLEWEHQKNAKFYVVKISGEDIRDDYLVGTQTSLEFYFNALVMKKPGERPKETRICANVTAMNEAGVVGKTPTCQYITIKSDTEA